MLVKEYEDREEKRRKKAVVATLEGKWAEMFLSTTWTNETIKSSSKSPLKCELADEVIKSTEMTPFKYELNIPRKGHSRERPILYISRNTKSFEQNYESTERELACVVWAFIKLRHLLEGSTTMIVTDHASIREIVRSSASVQYSTRIDKFRMLLAPFIDNMKVFYRPGKEMVNVDPLSRARYMGNNSDIPDRAGPSIRDAFTTFLTAHDGP